MDLLCYIEAVRQRLCHARPDDTSEFLWRRRRIAQKKNWTFWRAIIYAVKKEIEIAFKDKSIPAWLAAYILKLLRYILPYVVNHVYGAVAINCRHIGTNSDPPKIFIPISKIESNGCARSDLTICSLIF